MKGGEASEEEEAEEAEEEEKGAVDAEELGGALTAVDIKASKPGAFSFACATLAALQSALTPRILKSTPLFLSAGALGRIPLLPSPGQTERLSSQAQGV